MASTENDNRSSFDPPSPQDGFNAPSDEVKRRNLITAAIILGLVCMWILFGLRDMIF